MKMNKSIQNMNRQQKIFMGIIILILVTSLSYYWLFIPFVNIGIGYILIVYFYVPILKYIFNPTSKIKSKEPKAL